MFNILKNQKMLIKYIVFLVMLEQSELAENIEIDLSDFNEELKNFNIS